MASNSKNLGELLNTTQTVSPAFVSDQDNTSTGYFDLPNGTTAQRPSPTSGMIRFNSTLGLSEYYDGANWKSIDSPPSISTVTPSTFDASGDTITVNGDNFQSGINVILTASDGGTYTPDSITRVSSTEITFDITSSIVADPDDPFDITVTNVSGLSNTSANALTVAGTLTANTSAGSLGTVYDSGRSSLSYDLGVTDSSSESDVSFTYSVTSGSVPSGLSLNTSTGAVTGTADAVGSDTTYNFTITATGSDSSDSDYSETLATAYSLSVNAPLITSYTSTGSGTFSVPSGITAVDVLVVAGGGSGGCDTGGGGGAGGLIYRPAYPVTPGGSVSYTVGGGGPYSLPVINNQTNGISGQNSVFGQLTAQGGGGGTSGAYGTGTTQSGGSGGGGRRAQNTDPAWGGIGTQPQQPGDSGTYGFGNPGHYGDTDTFVSGGGGGAGAAATTSGSRAHGYNGPVAPYLEDGGGGAGKSYSISGSSVTYAGGGGGGSENLPGTWRSGGGPGGGGNGGYRSSGMGAASNGTTNRGGGGGGAGQNPEGGAGGSGIVIVSY
jgi:hypothetical protein